MKIPFEKTLKRLRSIPSPAIVILSTAACTAVLNKLLDYYKKDAVINEKLKLEQMLRIQENHYNKIMSYMHETRAAQHDMRHHFSVLDRYISDNDTDGLVEYLLSISNNAVRNSTLTICDNIVADAVAKHYLGLAVDAGIEVDAALDIPADVGIDAADLCIVLGNGLENAFEAAAKTSPGFIRVRAENSPSTLTLVIGNNYAGTLQENGGLFLSTKNADRDGIGLSSIRAIAEKYDGYAKFEARDGTFYTNVILFKPMTT